MAKKKKTRADGLIEKTVTDPRTKKRIHFYGHTDAEINRKMIEYNESQEKGRLFREVAEEWKEQHFQTLAPNSLKNYNPAYKRAIEFFGDTPIKKIAPQDIHRYINAFSKTRAKKTVSTQLLILHLIFGYAVTESNDILVNPCTDVKIPKGLSQSKRDAATTADERIIKETPNVWLFPYFLLYTGMRKGEALAIEFSDFDWENSEISVTKSVFHNPNKPEIKKPKTEAGNRKIPFLDPLKEVIPKEGNGFLFSLDGGKTPLSESQYNLLWKNYVKTTGITCTAHQLRHSFATMLFECEIDIKDAQIILGHSTAAMTQDVYIHIRESRRIETGKILNERLKECKTE